MSAPPPLAVALFALSIQSPDDAELGDLVEEFEARWAEDAGRARRWFWSQVLRSLIPNLLVPVSEGRVRVILLTGGLGIACVWLVGHGSARIVNALQGTGMLPDGAPTLAAFVVLSALLISCAGRLLRDAAGSATPLVVTLVAVSIIAPEVLHLVTGSESGPLLPILWMSLMPPALGFGAALRSGPVGARE